MVPHRYAKMNRRLANLIAIIILSGCLQPVDINTDALGGKVIISGQVSNLEGESVVTIGLTAESDRLPYPVSGAVVNLFEGDEFAGSYTEDPFIPGKYKLPGFAGTAGNSYHVQVIMPDDKTYASVPETMPPDAGSITPYYEIVAEEAVNGEGNLAVLDFVKIYANAVLPSNRYIRWSVEEVYMALETPDPTAPLTPPPCFVTQDAEPQAIILLDRQYLASNDYPDLYLARREVDVSFMLRHYFITYQTSLTVKAYDYWRKVEILVGQNGSVFEIPPAKVFGNVKNTSDESEEVFGYFQASHQSFGRVLLTRDVFPYILNFNDCVGGGVMSFPLPQRCIRCLSIRNSSLERPPWF